MSTHQPLGPTWDDLRAAMQRTLQAVDITANSMPTPAHFDTALNRLEMGLQRRQRPNYQPGSAPFLFDTTVPRALVSGPPFPPFRLPASPSLPLDTCIQDAAISTAPVSTAGTSAVIPRTRQLDRLREAHMHTPQPRASALMVLWPAAFLRLLRDRFQLKRSRALLGLRGLRFTKRRKLTPTVPNGKSFPFLALPTEIRLEIYRILLRRGVFIKMKDPTVHKNVFMKRSRRGFSDLNYSSSDVKKHQVYYLERQRAVADNRPMHPAILQVCRQPAKRVQASSTARTSSSPKRPSAWNSTGSSPSSPSSRPHTSDGSRSHSRTRPRDTTCTISSSTRTGPCSRTWSRSGSSILSSHIIRPICRTS